MKAPDKIYLHKIRDEESSGFYKMWFEQRARCVPSEEYIRKDALMDYFHQRVEELNSPLNGVFGSTEREHCNERILELLLLIDKLNSM